MDCIKVLFANYSGIFITFWEEIRISDLRLDLSDIFFSLDIH